VIGGGDWAKDRIVPDCVRALQADAPIPVRNKVSTRPWQHVLDPLACYLWLAAVLSNPSLRPYDASLITSPFNFGPGLEANRTVADLVAEVLKHWPGTWDDRSDPNAVHEAQRLNLATDKAFHLLGLRPVWNFERAIASTVDWYRRSTQASGASADEISALTSEQIAAYRRDGAAIGVPWAG
jgi:CDP-glucose 4,6-dehydratase